MKSIRFAVVVMLTLLVAGAALAQDLDALRLVPGDAAAVGMVKVSDLRDSAFFSKVFSEADRATVDGEAAKFLMEAGLDPVKDVDTLVFAMRPLAGAGEADVLLAIEGRFDVEKMTAALTTRGATRVTTGKGSYLVLPDADEKKGAISFINKRLAVVGTEKAVVNALNAVTRGGTGFRTSTLGLELARVDSGASAWVVVDVARASKVANQDWSSKSQKAPAVVGAVKNVSYVSFWAKDSGDSLTLGGTALSADAETRQLVEDTAKGMLAAWRLAAQDKHPELIPVLRKFEVEANGEGVTFRGTVPAELLNQLKKQHHEKAK